MLYWICTFLTAFRFSFDIFFHLTATAFFEAFGFDVYEVDGHDCDALSVALKKTGEKPSCVIANTIKGKGVSFIEGVKEWHHHTLSAEEYEQARKEVENV